MRLKCYNPEFRTKLIDKKYKCDEFIKIDKSIISKFVFGLKYKKVKISIKDNRLEINKYK